MSGNNIYWGCTSCRSTFRVNRQITAYTIELWTLIRGKKYILHIFPEADKADLIDEKGQNIHHFNPAPNINPKNIESKITTILTFL
jgi:hypothetical protein